ncbi:Protein PIR [Apostasia shenzhenica]|uniref:Protein PIR n=1 Tax=Apostasia shenzhenica TaxID=1088818 RepID=A0A2I0BGM0_9ASPA|nr:Protein PIR [Apostasia shenzhenica]
MLLRVLPVLVVLATSSDKDAESLYRRVKINRLINIFKNDPVIPAFPDLHLSPVAIFKELSMYFPSFSSQIRLLTLPAPHEIPPREMQEYPDKEWSREVKGSMYDMVIEGFRLLSRWTGLVWEQCAWKFSRPL